MFILSPAGEPDRPRPVILYGYGSFGHSRTPAFNALRLAWVEAGGVYAIANVRGGGEEGQAWHRAGMRENKQNTFLDFHAAGDYLVDQGWTTRAQLGIHGGSAGGQLVGAALTQRPDAYAAVLCSAPLLDLVRYEQHLARGADRRGSTVPRATRRSSDGCWPARPTTMCGREPFIRRPCSPCSRATPGSTRCTRAS